MQREFLLPLLNKRLPKSCSEQKYDLRSRDTKSIVFYDIYVLDGVHHLRVDAQKLS